MASEPLTFLWVEIEGFRGFRDKQRIDLDASMVIVTGPNGTGKTSFFDALQWLLLGSIERLEPLRLRRNTEHIVNAFRGDQPAIVSAAIQVGKDIAEIRREGRYDAAVLEWSGSEGVLHGQEAERRLAQALSARAEDKVALRRHLMTSALLQQDVVREVLEDKPADRYRQLGSLLGVDEVREFEAAARARADRHSTAGRSARQSLSTLDTQLTRARAAAEKLQAQQASAPDTELARAELAERLQRHADVLALTVELPSASADALLLQSNVRDLGDYFANVVRELEQVRADAASLESIDPTRADTVRTEQAQSDALLAEARTALEKAEAALAVARSQSEALAALASTALPLLGARCPVCEQEIDRDEVERHLRELMAAGGADLPRLEQERGVAAAAVADAEKRKRTADSEAVAVERREAAAKGVGRRQETLASAVQEGVVRAASAGIELSLGNDNDRLNAQRLAATVDGLRTLWGAAGDLASVLRALPTGEQLTAAEGEVRRLEILVAEAREQTAAASAREEEARTLQRAATRAAAAVSNARFRLLVPLISDIFSRLDPHPVFKDLDFALGVYNERGVASPVVRDTELDVEAEPLTVFSSSQANVAALSVFLSLGWAAGADAMPFVLLDDPLQSLDDVNALGFADLCRHIRRQRQLIVSTHDRRLAGLLERKLAPRVAAETTRVVEFKSWTRRGPELEQRVVDTQVAEGRARRLVAIDAA